MLVAHLVRSTVEQPPSAWAFGWEAVVAITTGLLAFGTGVLAFQTWRLARTTKAEIDSTFRPVLLLADPTRSGAGIPISPIERTGAGGRIRVVNSGSGPAIATRLADPRDQLSQPSVSIANDGEVHLLAIKLREGLMWSVTSSGIFDWILQYHDLSENLHSTRITGEIKEGGGLEIYEVRPFGTKTPPRVGSQLNDWIIVDSSSMEEPEADGR